MLEIQQVMFNMGIVDNDSFQSYVTKDSAGKRYIDELSKELESYLVKALEKHGGVMSIIDFYCMYNRARGTNLISPEDIREACERFNQNPQCKVELKKYAASGVVVVQSSKYSCYVRNF